MVEVEVVVSNDLVADDIFIMEIINMTKTIRHNTMAIICIDISNISNTAAISQK